MLPAPSLRRRRLCWPPLRGVLLLGPALVLLVISVAPLLRRGGVHTDVEQRHPTDDVVREPPPPPAVSSPLPSPTFPLVDEFSLSPGIKRFDNEDARLVGFPVGHDNVTADGREDVGGGGGDAVVFLATRFFGEWNPRHFYFLHSGNATFARYRCPVSNCDVTRDPSRVAQADAVLFHVRDTEVFSVPSHRSPAQLWILYSMEPPWLEVRDLRRFDGLFNWTMSYRAHSDVTVRYGFVGRRKAGRRPFLPPREVPAEKADRAVWLVSDCKTDSNREGFVGRLRRVYPVDVVGGCGRGPSCRPAETRRCYLEVARRYKFYLAFENALCQDYVTEKLFNALEYFVVPVALGGADYSRLTPRGSIIDATTFTSPEALGRYLWEVSGNDSLYLSHFEWKASHASYLQPWMCDMCEKLQRHRQRRRPDTTVAAKTGRALERWWAGSSPCLRWTEDGGFREVERHPFPEYRTRLFADEEDDDNERGNRRKKKLWRAATTHALVRD